jgi:hypothetical protein
MPTFITTPATLWVIPTTVTAITGRVDPAEDCNVLDVPGEPILDATCQDHVAQDDPDSL